MKSNSSRTPTIIVVCLLLSFTFLAPSASAQDGPGAMDKEIYNQLKAFSLTGGIVEVKDLELKKHRVQLKLTGVVYLSAPINGQTTGTVFIGEGRFAAETPPSEFEKENVKRLIGSNSIQCPGISSPSKKISCSQKSTTQSDISRCSLATIRILYSLRRFIHLHLGRASIIADDSANGSRQQIHVPVHCS